MLSRTIGEIKVGDWAGITEVVTEYDGYGSRSDRGNSGKIELGLSCAGVTGTASPRRMAPGTLMSSFIYNALGTHLLGPGSQQVHQTCYPLRPVYIGDKITTTVEVVHKDEVKNMVWLRTVCTNQGGKLVARGRAVLLLPGHKTATA
ncbi:MAG: enoyl-CoA hydratase [Syntrophomonadaceae bacterium]|nr:enoyl-CoA hydratase [Syntrophomonadaceae bacterium]